MTRNYSCGCSASGKGNVPKYCPVHGMPNAEKCKALGCTRKTKNAHGFCFQHADMRPQLTRK